MSVRTLADMSDDWLYTDALILCSFSAKKLKELGKENDVNTHARTNTHKHASLIHLTRMHKIRNEHRDIVREGKILEEKKPKSRMS